MITFFDYDKVECVTLQEAKRRHPHIDWDNAHGVWGMHEHTDKGFDGIPVIALLDLHIAIYRKANDIPIDEKVNYADFCHCAVCSKFLSPDDEVYTDQSTMDNLCDRHSYWSDKDENYHKIIFPNFKTILENVKIKVTDDINIMLPTEHLP